MIYRRVFSCPCCDYNEHAVEDRPVFQGHVRLSKTTSSFYSDMPNESSFCQVHECLDPSSSIARLTDWLRQPDSTSSSRPGLRDRKLIGLMLALSMLHIVGQRWSQSGFDRDAILVVPHQEGELRAFRPLVYCDLRPKSDLNTNLNIADCVAALGILILELEAGKEVHPTSANAAGSSNMVRLGQILEDDSPDSTWSQYIDDKYRSIAGSCFEFHKAVAHFDNDDNRFTGEIAPVAFLYKHIFMPLYKLTTERFGATANFFPRIQDALSIPVDVRIAQPVFVFDDWTMAGDDGKRYVLTYLAPKHNLPGPHLAYMQSN